MAKQIYKTARGVEIDMIKMVQKNEMELAVGNARVNARGDRIGPNGQIIKTREEILAERAGMGNGKDLNGHDPEGNE
jgi:hypothetical protein